MTGKRFNVFDVDGTIFLEDHKEGSYHIGEIGNVDVNCLNDIADRLNELVEENKKLQSINQDHRDYIGDVEADFIRLEQENKKLKKENKELEELVSEVDNELEDRDTVCGAGKFRLEEWGKHRYHQFYKGDEELEDETVVIMLMELEKENKEIKSKCEFMEKILENKGYSVSFDVAKDRWVIE